MLSVFDDLEDLVKKAVKKDSSTSAPVASPPGKDVRSLKPHVLSRDQQVDDELDVLDGPTEIIMRPVPAGRDADRG